MDGDENTGNRSVTSDRRSKPRGGRRGDDSQKPWYMRRRLWLAAASMMFVGWKRVRRIARSSIPGTGGNIPA
jgi:hypothetical protein